MRNLKDIRKKKSNEWNYIGDYDMGKYGRIGDLNQRQLKKLFSVIKYTKNKDVNKLLEQIHQKVDHYLRYILCEIQEEYDRLEKQAKKDVKKGLRG